MWINFLSPMKYFLTSQLAKVIWTLERIHKRGKKCALWAQNSIHKTVTWWKIVSRLLISISEFKSWFPFMLQNIASLLFLFWKNKVGLWHHVAVRARVCITPINSWTPEPIFIKLGTYITAPEPISKAWLKNPSHQSLCLYVYPLSLLRNGSVS
jgi:hypothetical protein